MCTVQNIIRMVKLRKVEMGGACSKYGKITNFRVILKIKSVREKQFGRSSSRCKNDIKMYLMCEALDIIQMGQDTVQWQVFLYQAMSWGCFKKGFLKIVFIGANKLTS